MNKITRCGYVAIVGRPNVGKSTLLNYLLGQKISITSRKPQTTRYQILGIKTKDDTQVIYVDTPGLHWGARGALNRYLNRTAQTALQSVDVVIFVIEVDHFHSMDDQWVLEKLKKINIPVLLVINKIDKIKNRERLLPFMEKLSRDYSFKNIIPISAKTGEQVDTVEQAVMACLSEGPYQFPPDQVTDRGDQFMATEIIREKAMRQLGQELPYALAVTLVLFEREPTITRISAVIWVEKDSQKGIVIGKGGERLKKIGTQARLSLEKIFEEKVFLQLWVKVKSHWSGNAQLLKELGFE